MGMILLSCLKLLWECCVRKNGNGDDTRLIVRKNGNGNGDDTTELFKITLGMLCELSTMIVTNLLAIPSTSLNSGSNTIRDPFTNTSK